MPLAPINKVIQLFKMKSAVKLHCLRRHSIAKSHSVQLSRLRLPLNSLQISTLQVKKLCNFVNRRQRHVMFLALKNYTKKFPLEQTVDLKRSVKPTIHFFNSHSYCGFSILNCLFQIQTNSSTLFIFLRPRRDFRAASRVRSDYNFYLYNSPWRMQVPKHSFTFYLSNYCQYQFIIAI